MTARQQAAADLAISAALVLAVSTGLAVAQGDYPNRTIKIVVPIPPGGFADTFPRLIAEKLSTRWGRPVVVENRPGGSLNVAAEAVAKAEPDGYTLLATPPGPLVTNQFLYRNLGFDPAAFVPVTILAKSPFVLVVRASHPARSLQELVAYAKSNPDKINFASSGAGSPPHLLAEMLKAKAGIRLVHIPYKGLTPALTDVAAGHVDMMFHDPSSTLPQIRAGQVRALGVSSAKRIRELPDVPAIAEVLPDFVAETFYAVVAPPKTPAPVVARLSEGIGEILRLPEIARILGDSSIVAVGSTSAEARAFLGIETKRWRDVVDAAGLKPE